MIYSKDRVSREKLIRLIEFSLSPECQFLVATKPPTQIVNDHEVREGSVVKFLKVEEKVFSFDTEGRREHRLAFALRVLVEDDYLVPPEGAEQNYGTRPVPSRVLNRVAEILNDEVEHVSTASDTAEPCPDDS